MIGRVQPRPGSGWATVQYGHASGIRGALADDRDLPPRLLPLPLPALVLDLEFLRVDSDGCRVHVVDEGHSSLRAALTQLRGVVLTPSPAAGRGSSDAHRRALKAYGIATCSPKSYRGGVLGIGGRRRSESVAKVQVKLAVEGRGANREEIVCGGRFPARLIQHPIKDPRCSEHALDLLLRSAGLHGNWDRQTSEGSKEEKDR
eukprot:768640-Hanusia_phi.AAC.12